MELPKSQGVLLDLVCDKLKLSKDTKMMVEIYLEELFKYGEPITIFSISGSVWLAARKNKEYRTQREIGEITKVAASTIRKKADLIERVIYNGR